MTESISRRCEAIIPPRSNAYAPLGTWTRCLKTAMYQRGEHRVCHMHRKIKTLRTIDELPQ